MSLDDAQREMGHLSQLLADEREKNTRLLAAWKALDCDCETPGTVKCREAIREGFQRPLREENTRLHMEEGHAGCEEEHCEVTAIVREAQDGMLKLVAANTPLLAALRSMVGLSVRNDNGYLCCRFCDASTHIENSVDDLRHTAKCPAGRALPLLEKHPVPEPGGDVTTSDKAPFRNPALEHVFRPAPFYPEQCDVKLDDHGRPRTCARPRSEHQEDWSEKPCSCGAVQNCWAKVASHQTRDGVKHRKESCA